MIDIAIMRLKNDELAERLYRRGMAILKDPASRDALDVMYKGIRSRLKSRGSNTIKPSLPRNA